MVMNRSIQIHFRHRGLCLHSALSLLFFLIFSAPHRVHHSFEKIGAAELVTVEAATSHDGDQHHDNPSSLPAQSECTILHSTQNTHGVLITVVEWSVFVVPRYQGHIASTFSAQPFDLAPHSQRAPPVI